VGFGWMSGSEAWSEIKTKIHQPIMWMPAPQSQNKTLCAMLSQEASPEFSQNES
jgi:hypothetical protein